MVIDVFTETNLFKGASSITEGKCVMGASMITTPTCVIGIEADREAQINHDNSRDVSPKLTRNRNHT